MGPSPAVRVLFVCHANVCRSPIAEAAFNALARDAGLDARAGSAGVAALKGEDMDANARSALEEVGIYPDDHRARQVDQILVGDADLVLTMNPRQREMLSESFGSASPMIDVLSGYASGASSWDGIADPHGRPMRFYRATCREILEHVNALVQLMASPQQTRR